MGRLRQALQGQKVYLDANIFIYSVEMIAPWANELNDVLIFAANVRAQTGLKLPDAIHAATALTQQCTAMLTNDPGFKRVPGIELFLLSDWTSSPC